MDLDRFLRIAIQIATALSTIHRDGLVHLNIRPGNVAFDPETGDAALKGAPLRTDLLTSEEPRIDPASLPYVAPEQTGRLDRPIDQRADLYSLGVTLYELFAGRRPFEAEDAPGWVHCHIARTPTALSEALPGAPEVISDIVMKLLAKSPEDRYQSAEGLTADLQVCLAEVEALGTAEPFPLGTSDVWDKLRIPTKLYGRSNERAALLTAFARVVGSGEAELVLVSGYSGIGKTSLVKEVQEPIVRERGYFISGKFEQLQRDIPYRTLTQAFGELVRQILTESPERLGSWKQRLEQALGRNGRVITDIIPQLTFIIGEQPQVSSLPASEAQHRLLSVFMALLGAIAQAEHPLVLFLDDLQWADPASLTLLRRLFEAREARHFMAIGAYRDNEVSPSHPLTTTLNDLREAGARVSDIHVGPLPREHILELVMDTFRCDHRRAAPLVRLLADRTDGNPFFVGQFLTELYRDRLVFFDPANVTWRWDMQEIEARNLTDNVVDLVLGRLKRLGADTQRALMLAACLGSRIEADVLSTMHGRSREATDADMSPALREGLMARRGGVYKFLHDRVQQAAYLLIPEEERPETHLRIGRLLLVRTSDERLDERLFEITNQLSIGAALITDPGERRRTVELNLRAGRKAKASAAYGSAVAYLSTATSLLPEHGWEDDALAFSLHIELAECTCLGGDLERSERLSSMLIERSKTKLDRAAAYRLRMQVHTIRSEHNRCIDLGMECLASLGAEIPRSPTDEDVLGELSRLRDDLRARSDDDIIDQPRMTDPAIIAVMSIIAMMYPSSFYMNPNLNDALVCRMVRLSLRHGYADASGIGYTSLGKALCMRLGAYKDGDRIGKLGYDLNEKWNVATYRPEVINIFASVISVWTRHIDTLIDFSRRGIQASIEVGNATWGSFNYIQLTLGQLVRGDPLKEVHATSVTGIDFATKAKLTFVVEVILIIQRFVQSMRGLADRFGSLSGDAFDEQSFEAHLEKDGYPGVRLLYQLLKCRGRLLAGDGQGAAQAAAAAERDISGGNGMITSAEYHCFSALARAAYLSEAPAEAHAEHRKALTAHQEQLRVWAESCPDNFAGTHALVSAEIARLEQRPMDAAALYDQAILAFRRSGFIHQEGLASELAARFYLDRGFANLPGLYLREALSAYSRWGASGKVGQLEQRYARVLDQEQRRATSRSQLSIAAEEFDAQAAFKVSRALSGEMTPQQMMSTLMRLVIEHAGAERCCLLLGEDLWIAAEANVSKSGVDIGVFERGAIALPDRVPMSIINYVRRTRERLLLNDSAEVAAFAADEYLRRERPKSVLCLPLMKGQAALGGLLYLENKLVQGAFIPRRLTLLEFLAVISLQNAVLREELARESAERKQAEETLRRSEERLRILAEAASGGPPASEAPSRRQEQTGEP